MAFRQEMLARGVTKTVLDFGPLVTAKRIHSYQNHFLFLLCFHFYAENCNLAAILNFLNESLGILKVFEKYFNFQILLSKKYLKYKYFLKKVFKILLKILYFVFSNSILYFQIQILPMCGSIRKLLNKILEI